MDKQCWVAFDSDLRIRIEESRQSRYDTPQSTGNMDKNIDKLSIDNMGEEYAQLTQMVKDSIVS